jgi:hypothetical protein
MTAHAEIAVAFATALVDGDFIKAHALLSPALRKEMTSETIRTQMFEMWSGYASGDPKEIDFRDGSALEDWPAKMAGDRAWVFVGISGDEFNEMVALLVAEMEGKLLIREIQWGRP